MRPYAPQNRCMKVFTGHQHSFERNSLRCDWSPDGTKVSSHTDAQMPDLFRLPFPSSARRSPSVAVEQETVLLVCLCLACAPTRAAGVCSCVHEERRG